MENQQKKGTKQYHPLFTKTIQKNYIPFGLGQEQEINKMSLLAEKGFGCTTVRGFFIQQK